jgi:hypothetical protein
MSYFIFTKNSENIENTCYKIAENQSDLNNLNINQESFKIIEETELNFNLVKYGNKIPLKYIDNTITYNTGEIRFKSKDFLQKNIENFKKQIKQFTDNNPNHSLLNRWNSYHNQLNNLNLDLITYPLDKSLEQYFNDLGQPSYNILQIP